MIFTEKENFHSFLQKIFPETFPPTRTLTFEKIFVSTFLRHSNYGIFATYSAFLDFHGTKEATFPNHQLLRQILAFYKSFRFHLKNQGWPACMPSCWGRKVFTAFDIYNFHTGPTSSENIKCTGTSWLIFFGHGQ